MIERSRKSQRGGSTVSHTGGTEVLIVTDTTEYTVGAPHEKRSVTGLAVLTGDPGEVGAGAGRGEGDVAGVETVGIRTLI